MTKQEEVNHYYEKCEYLKDQIYRLNADYHLALIELERVCRVYDLSPNIKGESC